MRNFIRIALLVMLSSGCNTLAHMDQLLTLKDIGDEQAAIDHTVALQDKEFEKLFAAAQKESFAKNYPTKKKILSAFGEPIFARPEVKDNKELEFLLYRRAKEFFDSDKVYLYFDGSGQLVSFEVLKKQKTASK